MLIASDISLRGHCGPRSINALLQKTFPKMTFITDLNLSLLKPLACKEYPATMTFPYSCGSVALVFAVRLLPTPEDPGSNPLTDNIN